MSLPNVAIVDLPQYDDTETPHQRKLREIRAQRAALVSAREARQAERDEERELEAETQALRDEVALNDAIEKHGDIGIHIATVPTPKGLVILKRASAMKFRRFQDKGEANTEDVAALVRPCIVWPTPAEIDVLLDEYPAVLLKMASAVIALAGQGGDQLAKK